MEMIWNLKNIFQASVSAVLPKNLIKKALKCNQQSESLEICGKFYNIKNKNVYVVGFGKAVQYMARETESILGNKIKGGIISIPFNSLEKSCVNERLKYIEGAKNNLPDQQAQETAEKILDLATSLKEDDMLLVLISGGGSALLPLPKQPINLEEKTYLIKQLANSGADITELNIVRKKISQTKGGKLALSAQPAEVVSLILSDIVNDPLDLIASGPTVEDKYENMRALQIVQKYDIYKCLPDSIKSVLSGTQKEFIWPHSNVSNYLIGSNKISIQAAIKMAEKLKYSTLGLSNTVTGDIKLVAEEYVKITKLFCDLVTNEINLKQAATRYGSIKIDGINKELFDKDLNLSNKVNLCLILGGEITVQVKGAGVGGRNQQLALEYSSGLHEIKKDLEGLDICFLSAGTDGIDGPTDAAGAIGYKDLISDAHNDGVDVNKFLKDNNSYNFYKIFMNGTYHVITGHTNTNVMDIHIILISKNK